ncbi:MAG: class I SAM-dependent methyltransferase [Patescibacteria group bacterium]|nr:class I SAM-dependent methyltransferase [Patescibacteria group bacterium]
MEFVVTNGKDLRAVGDRKFDLVFSILVFQHLPREIFLKYLKESSEVLKSGGKLLFQIPIYQQQKPKEPPKNHPWGLRFYSLGELRESLEKLKYSEIKFLDVSGNKSTGKESQVFVLASNLKKI